MLNAIVTNFSAELFAIKIRRKTKEFKRCYLLYHCVLCINTCHVLSDNVSCISMCDNHIEVSYAYVVHII